MNNCKRRTRTGKTLVFPLFVFFYKFKHESDNDIQYEVYTGNAMFKTFKCEQNRKLKTKHCISTDIVKMNISSYILKMWSWASLYI